MIKKIKKILNSKFISVVIIPLILLAFWFFASLIFYHKVSFSVLTYVHNEPFINVQSGKLLKGEKIGGEFKAKDNHLGIVMIEFNNFVKPDFAGEDVLTFRIKEKDSKTWYHTSNFKSGILENELLFPFGIPRIDNSKGKIYEFELQSLYGNDRNAISLGEGTSHLVTGYQYPKIEITGSKIRFLSFAYKKTISSFTDFNFILASTLYLLPFLLYVFQRVIFKNSNKIVSIFSVFILVFIFLDIFLVKEIYLGILIELIAGWIYCLWKIKIDNRKNFLIAFILITFWVIIILLKIDNFQNKINIWVYTFLVIGFVQSVIEEKYNKKLT